MLCSNIYIFAFSIQHDLAYSVSEETYYYNTENLLTHMVGDQKGHSRERGHLLSRGGELDGEVRWMEGAAEEADSSQM